MGEPAINVNVERDMCESCLAMYDKSDAIEVVKSYIHPEHG